jgi:hypothetical protein
MLMSEQDAGAMCAWRKSRLLSCCNFSESNLHLTGGLYIPFSVEDIPETLRRINANGGKTVMPKTGIGEYQFIGPSPRQG